MPLYAIGEREPTIADSAFVHPDAVIIGDVTIGPESTVWPAAVLRGDHGAIRIGARTSVQDGAVIHCTATHDTVVGDGCTIGHLAHLEGCVVEDDCLVGSGSAVLHRAVLRRGSLVGAQALVTNDTEVPAGAMALGVPARILPDRVPAGANAAAAEVYVGNAHWYNAELRRLD